uniref:Uncharacterized protein n=1 Tax=Arundo donax TaxID=35708 RepID=A0A0A9CR49_ARUDO
MALLQACTFLTTSEIHSWSFEDSLAQEACENQFSEILRLWMLLESSMKRCKSPGTYNPHMMLHAHGQDVASTAIVGLSLNQTPTDGRFVTQDLYEDHILF